MKADSLSGIIFILVGLLLSVNILTYDLQKVDQCKAIGDKECEDWYGFLAMIQIIIVIFYVVMLFLNYILDRNENFY